MQGCHGQGKIRKFRLWSHRCIFFIVWRMRYELGQNLRDYILIQISFAKWFFFLIFICFHVLHNVRHKMSTIFMMLKTFFCTSLFSRPLCWRIYWWIMWFLCGFKYITKNHLSDWNLCWQLRKNQGNVREYFYGNPVVTVSNCGRLIRLSGLSFRIGLSLLVKCNWNQVIWKYFVLILEV